MIEMKVLRLTLNMNQTLPGQTFLKISATYLKESSAFFQEAHLGTQKHMMQQRKLKASQINEASKLCW